MHCRDAFHASIDRDATRFEPSLTALDARGAFLRSLWTKEKRRKNATPCNPVIGIAFDVFIMHCRDAFHASIDRDATRFEPSLTALDARGASLRSLWIKEKRRKNAAPCNPVIGIVFDVFKMHCRDAFHASIDRDATRFEPSLTALDARGASLRSLWIKEKRRKNAAPCNPVIGIVFDVFKMHCRDAFHASIDRDATRFEPSLTALDARGASLRSLWIKEKRRKNATPCNPVIGIVFDVFKMHCRDAFHASIDRDATRFEPSLTALDARGASLRSLWIKEKRRKNAAPCNPVIGIVFILTGLDSRQRILALLFTYCTIRRGDGL